MQQLPHRPGFLTFHGHGQHGLGPGFPCDLSQLCFEPSFSEPVSTASFKTFVLGLVVGALGGYGLGHWLPLGGAAGAGASPPAPAGRPAATAVAPPLTPDQSRGALPATHPPLTTAGGPSASPAVRAACQSADADPGNYLAQMDAAAALYRAGNFAGALDYAQRARHLRPDSVDALLAVGVSQAELEQYDAAAKTLAQAVERRPDDADIRTELAYVHLRRKDFRAALAEAERAHRLAAHAERTLEIIVQSALALGDKDRAKAALDRLAAVNPGNPRLAELARALAAATPTAKGKPS